jgi:hypothetical protein
MLDIANITPAQGHISSPASKGPWTVPGLRLFRSMGDLSHDMQPQLLHRLLVSRGVRKSSTGTLKPCAAHSTSISATRASSSGSGSGSSLVTVSIPGICSTKGTHA